MNCHELKALARQQSELTKAERLLQRAFGHCHGHYRHAYFD